MMKAALITIGVELSLCTVPWVSVGRELIMFASVLSFQLHCFNYGPHMQAVHTPKSFLCMNCKVSYCNKILFLSMILC